MAVHLVVADDQARTLCGSYRGFMSDAMQTLDPGYVDCFYCQRMLKRQSSSTGDEPEKEPVETRNLAEDESPPSIADRVRFWEEQDKINQVLIPRVIKQADLLTAHIGEHENLPEVVSRAIAAALQEALAEQEEKYQAALAEQSRQYQSALEAQERQYQSALEAQEQQYQSVLEAQERQYQSALESQERQYEAKLSEAIARASDSIEKRAVKVRILLVGLAVAGVATGLGSLLLNLLG